MNPTRQVARAAKRSEAKPAPPVNGKPVAAAGPAAPATFSRPVIEYKYCATCRFLDITNPQQMFCRRYPAQLVVTEPGKIRALYPVVTPMQDWCGEHQDIPSQE